MSYKKLTLSTKLTFGKYVFDTVFEIMKKDPSYIKWLVTKWEGDIDYKITNWLKEIDEKSITTNSPSETHKQ